MSSPIQENRIEWTRFLMHPKGILEQCDLPNKRFDDLWERIFVAEEMKSRLISQVLLEFTIRDKINSGALPLHGIILLVGTSWHRENFAGKGHRIQGGLSAER